MVMQDKNYNMVPRRSYTWQFSEYLVSYLWNNCGHELRTKVPNRSVFTLLCDWFRGKKRFPYKKERSEFRSGRKPMSLLITIWLVARELACSGQLVKCGAKSQTGGKNNGEREREIEILCSHSLPHPPSLFFLLASFCAIPAIWTPGTGHKRACVRKTVVFWVLSYMFPDQNCT